MPLMLIAYCYPVFKALARRLQSRQVKRCGTGRNPERWRAEFLPIEFRLIVVYL